MFNVNKEKVKSANLFAAGLALGTVGLKMLTSKDAKKVYANVVAAGLRAKESVMQTAEKYRLPAAAFWLMLRKSTKIAVKKKLCLKKNKAKKRVNN